MALPPSNKELASMWIKSSLLAFLSAVIIHGVYNIQKIVPSTPFQIDCTKAESGQPFDNYSEFYPFYLCEHSLPTTKLFHFVATFNIFVLLWLLINAKSTSTKIRIWIFSVIQGYGLAWISHFWIEENKPATFKYPVYSFISDFVMFKDACLGNVSLF